MHLTPTRALDEIDRRIVNELQSGFPISDTPFDDVAVGLGIDGRELIDRLRSLVDDGLLSRFGPMYNAERMQGAVTLAAMIVPEQRFDEVADIVNRKPEVAHNYERTHQLNMWFVLATEDPDDIAKVIGDIERETGLRVYNMPKKEEFFVGLKLTV